MSSEKLTPYQGKKRSFGIFECSKCKRKWRSACSWANKYQECINCVSEVYPHKQFPLKRNNKKDISRRPHQEQLCQKCKKLRRCCLNAK